MTENVLPNGVKEIAEVRESRSGSVETGVSSSATHALPEADVSGAILPSKKAWNVDAGSKPISIADVDASDVIRIPTGIGELDRVLGHTGEISGMVPGSVVLLTASPGAGKGKPPEASATRFLNPISGAFEPLIDADGEGHQVLCLDEESFRLSPAVVSSVITSTPNTPLLLTTHLGRRLIVDGDDELLTGAGWIPTSRLTPGDWIATARHLPFFGSGVTFDHFVKLLAYVISDGHTDSSTSITTAIPEVAEDIIEIAAWFNLELRTDERAGNRAKSYFFRRDQVQRKELKQHVIAAIKRALTSAGLSSHECAKDAGLTIARMTSILKAKITPTYADLEAIAGSTGIPVAILCPDFAAVASKSSPIAVLLENTGLRHLRSARKFVPSCIFELTRNQIALFLKVLFTCDGSIFVESDARSGLSYSTISRRLAEDVQHLLLRFGIVTRLRTKPMPRVREGYLAYELVAAGVEPVKRFLREIGIVGREEAKDRIESMPNPSLPSTRRDTIPVGPWFWEHLLSVSGSSTIGGIARTSGVTLHPERKKGPVTRMTVQKLAAVFPTPELSRLANGDVYWDTLSKIESIEGKVVFQRPEIESSRNHLENDILIRPAP